MKDIFQEFKQATLRKHLAIGTTALAFALGVNVALFNTDVGVKLQASAIEATKWSSVRESADILLAQGSAGTDRVQIRMGRAAQGVTGLELTLVADPEAIVFGEAAETEGGVPVEIVPVSSMPGVLLLKLRYPKPVQLDANSIVASVALKKKTAEAPVNIASPRLITSSGNFELTSQGITVR